MKIRYTTRLVPFLVLAASACSPPVMMDDAGPDAAADTGVRVDTGVRPDTGVLPDTGVVDTGVVTDTGVPEDVMAQPDAMDDAAADGSTGMDATPGMDAAPDVMSLPDSAPDALPDSAPDALPDSAPDAAAACPMPAGTLTLPMGSAMGMLTASGGINSRISCSTLNSFTSGEQNFTLNVATRTGITLTTANAATASDLDTAIVIRRTCNDIASEIACDDDGSTSSPRSYARAVLEPGTYSVIVDGYSGDSGPFQLDYASFTPAANATCSTATALMDGMATTGSTANGGGNNSPCRSGTSTIVGGQVYYSFAIPANSRVSFAVTATGAQNVRAYLTDSCSATTCAGSTTTSTMGTAVNVVAGNTTAAPRTVILAIASTSLTVDGAFSITPTVTMLAPNANCATPAALAVGGMAMGDTAGAGSTAACSTSDNPQLYYSVSVPANTRGNFTITRGAAQNVRARVLDSCTAMTCAQSTVTSAATAAPFAIRNTTASAATYLIAASSSSAITPAGFTLAFTGTAPIPANAACAAPTVLAPGGMTNVDTTSGGAIPTGCSTTEGDVLFYSVTVPATSSVSLSLTRGSSQNMRMRVLDTCAAATCLASPVTSSATAVTAALDNTTAAPRTFIVAVGSDSATTGGTATLAVSTPSSIVTYTKTTVAAACDDMTMAMPAAEVLSISGDDATTTRTALPFSISYFGTTANEFSASTNGFAQLWTMGASGSPVSDFSNDVIPEATGTNSVIAPFWDDMQVDAPANVRTATFGMMGSRRFVIEWNNVRNRNVAGSSMRFQAKLFEGTNVIEFHYCALSDAMDAFLTGSSATIGIENQTGTRGTQHSNNTAMSITLANALRFTPSM